MSIAFKIENNLMGIVQKSLTHKSQSLKIIKFMPRSSSKWSLIHKIYSTLQIILVNQLTNAHK
jgi:hypothetical protein